MKEIGMFSFMVLYIIAVFLQYLLYNIGHSV